MGCKGRLFALSHLSLFLTFWSTASLEHIALVYIRPRYLQARQRQKQAEIRRRSNSALSIVPGFGFLQAVSEAVRDGDVSEEDEDKEEEEETGNTLEDSQE
jgi:hypothetical protein